MKKNQSIFFNNTALNYKESTNNKSTVDPYLIAKCSYKDARELIPFEIAKKLNILPLSVVEVEKKQFITIGCANPEDQELKKAIYFISNLPPKLMRIDKLSLEKAIFLAYKGNEKNLERAIDTLTEYDTSKLKNNYISQNKPSAPPGKFVESLINYAIAKNASDLHLTPENEGCFISARINGAIYSHDKSICSLETYSQIVNFLKVLSGLDITKKNIPQDGAFSWIIHKKVKLSIRINTMPTIYGERVVLRLPSLKKIVDLKNLGYSSLAINNIMQALSNKEGLILICAPTGNGKTTTMYSLMMELKKMGKTIVSIEDPVEIPIPGISQTSLNTANGLNYTTALKAALRQDPDVIVVGEIRDAKSAEAVLRSAFTGHLIISTIHSSTIEQAISRLYSLGIDNDLMISSLSLIISQRLIARLCPMCKVLDKNHLESNFTKYRPSGCPHCGNSGYNGLVLAEEFLRLNDVTKYHLRKKRSSLLDNQNIFKNNYYRAMKSSYIHLYHKGEISEAQFNELMATYNKNIL